MAHGRNRGRALKEIRVYVEGGGKGASNALFRTGFQAFLRTQNALAHIHRTKLRIIACGDRDSTVEDFLFALKSDDGTGTFFLLIDSEGPVNPTFLQTFKSQKGLAGVSEDRLHLMVEMMESWYFADVVKLEEYYGANFQTNSIPPTNDVETIAKSRIDSSLKDATRHTAKGRYKKIPHGPKILGVLDSSKVRGRAKHCDRFLSALEAEIRR